MKQSNVFVVYMHFSNLTRHTANP